MKKRILLFLAVLTAAVTTVDAQNLTGRVLSPDGQPIEGVILSIDGTRLAAMTDATGSFSLPVEVEFGTLRVVCQDYYTQVFPLRGSVIPDDIILVPRGEYRYSGEILLPEGALPRSQASSLMETVAKKDYSASPSAILSWQDAGSALMVGRKSGMPGEGAYLNLRGLHSLNADNTPLLVINGVPFLANTSVSDVINGYSRDALFGYNANDIRSITVLRGAEAAMYGSLGSNGVILIETEKADRDKLDTRISFAGNYGLSKAKRQLPMMNVSQYESYLTDIGQSRYSSLSALQKDYPFLAGTDDYYYSYLFNNSTDWTGLIYRNGLVTDNVLRVEGGDEVAKYNISFGYTHEDGILDQTATNRYHTSLNTNIMVSPDFEVFTSVNLAYLNSDLNNTGMSQETNPILAAWHMMPSLSPWQKLSNNGIIYGRYLKYNGWNVNSSPSFPYDNVSNPLALVRTVDATDKIYDADIRLGLNYRPNRYWTVTGLLSLYYDYTEEYVFTPGVTDQAIIPQLYGTGENFVSMGVIRQNAWFYNLNAAYRNTFDDIHVVNAYAGVRMMTKSYEYDASSGYNSANDYYRSLNKVTDQWNILGSNDEWRWLSFYAHASYVYDNLWRFVAGLTADGSSVSGINAPRFGLFPSASVTYLAANSGQMGENIDHFNITFELSKSGNSRFSSNYGQNYYVSNNLFNLGTIVRNGVPNTSLEWEKKTQTDIGVDLSLFRNKLGMRFAEFLVKHYDLLLDSKISAVYGSNEPYYANTASIFNNGFESSIRYEALRTSQMEWTLHFDAALQSSQITSLGDLDETIVTYAGDDAQTRLKKGSTPYEFYGYQTRGVYRSNAEALAPTAATGQPLKTPYGGNYQGGDVIFVDQNGDGMINDEDRVPLGSAAPYFFGSLGTSLRYGDWRLSADLGFSLGNRAYNAARRQTESMDHFYNQSVAVLNRWQIEGQQTDMPRAAYGDPSGNNLFSDRWIENASYLKLRRVALSYALSKDLLRYMDGQVWISAENLWSLSNYLGADPEFYYSYAEALRGFDYAKVSAPVTFKVGVNLNF